MLGAQRSDSFTSFSAVLGYADPNIKRITNQSLKQKLKIQKQSPICYKPIQSHHKMYLNLQIHPHLYQILLAFLGCAICDGLRRLLIPRAHRWYLLHFVANMFITVLTVPDLINLFLNPTQLSDGSTTWAKNLTLALHLYHIITFRGLTMDDWLHHILMSGAIILNVGNQACDIVNVCLFFTTGLPGGINYLLLVLVRADKMKVYTQKRINNCLNTWIRTPGILFGAVILHVNWRLGSIEIGAADYGVVFVILVLYWNACYFGNQVAVDFGYRKGNMESEKEWN